MLSVAEKLAIAVTAYALVSGVVLLMCRWLKC
jgi:hypothetical protein